MKKPECFTDEMVEIYNFFVSLSKKYGVLFQDVKIDIGYNEEDILGLHFIIETDSGFTKDEMQMIYGQLTDRYPWCGINYNVREVTALEKACVNAGVKVLRYTEGKTLEYINN